MDDKVLLKIINHCIGVIGYLDGRATSVEQNGDRIIVHWRNWHDGEPLLFDNKGNAIFEDGVKR